MIERVRVRERVRERERFLSERRLAKKDKRKLI